MTVTGDSPMLAGPRAAVERAQSIFLSKPNGSYSQDEVREIVALYWQEAEPVGLDPVVAVSQMALETGYLSSDWSQVPKRNPAGIGVTGIPGEGVSFPSWAQAVRAHTGRLLAYILRPDAANPSQEALIDEALSWRPLPSHLRGVAPLLKDYGNGIWAAAGGYAEKIASIANRMITPAGEENRCLLAHPFLKQGATGDGVRHLQDLLVRCGHDLGQEGGVNGVFSPGLRVEVVAYQRARGLEADGKVGRNTWTALHTEVGLSL